MHPGQDRDEPPLRKALSALREGDLGAAEAIVRLLLQNTPDDPAIHQLAAVIALQRGETAQATRWAIASLARRPDHVPTLIIAGRAARASKDFAGALAFFRRAAALAPDRADAAFLTCVTLLELGDAEAGTLLPRLLERFADDAEGWHLLGGALQRAGQPEAALVAFTRATQVMPSAALHLRRGVLLESLGRIAEAVEAYRQRQTRRRKAAIRRSSSLSVCAAWAMPRAPPRRLSGPLPSRGRGVRQQTQINTLLQRLS